MKDCVGRGSKMENEKLTVSAMNSMYLLFSIACNWTKVGLLFTGISLSKVDLN